MNYEFVSRVSVAEAPTWVPDHGLSQMPLPSPRVRADLELVPSFSNCRATGRSKSLYEFWKVSIIEHLLRSFAYIILNPYGCDDWVYWHPLWEVETETIGEHAI